MRVVRNIQYLRDGVVQRLIRALNCANRVMFVRYEGENTNTCFILKPVSYNSCYKFIVGPDNLEYFTRWGYPLMEFIQKPKQISPKVIPWHDIPQVCSTQRNRKGRWGPSSASSLRPFRLCLFPFSRPSAAREEVEKVQMPHWRVYKSGSPVGQELQVVGKYFGIKARVNSQGKPLNSVGWEIIRCAIIYGKCPRFFR